MSNTACLPAICSSTPLATSKTMAEPDAPERMRRKSPESSFIVSALVSPGALTLVGSDGLNTSIQSRWASASPGLAGASSSPGTKVSSSGGGWMMSFSSGVVGKLDQPGGNAPPDADAGERNQRHAEEDARRSAGAARLATFGPSAAETSAAAASASVERRAERAEIRRVGEERLGHRPAGRRLRRPGRPASCGECAERYRGCRARARRACPASARSVDGRPVATGGATDGAGRHRARSAGA